MNYLLGITFLAYLIYTLRFAVLFNKTADTYFSKKQKALHNILIWVIPFFWIMIVKAVASPHPTPGNSNRTRHKGRFYESGLGIWGHSEDHHSDHEGGHVDNGD